ncbi:MAG: nitrilase-related carbon-nitrogen hydrolase [Rhodospirillaceae bacterium]
MLYISQKSWFPDEIDALAEHIENINAANSRLEVVEPIESVILLPHSSHGYSATDKKDVLKSLSDLAAEKNVYLAGSVLVKSDIANVPCTLGFLISSIGDVLIEAHKISPELINGIATDQSSALGQPMEFKVANTPIGQVGILSGEDILFPHYARSLVWQGAELILNPSEEVSDDLFEARQNARIARAFENAAYIATSSAVSRGANGHSVTYPRASGFADWNGKPLLAKSDEDFMCVDVYIDKLRRRRAAIFGIQALHLRANLYADGYKKLIAAQTKSPVAPSNREAWVSEARERLATSKAMEGSGRETEYDVLLVQSVKKMIQKTSDVNALRTENIQRALTLPGRNASNPNVRLVALSEFFMTGQGGFGYRSPITLQRLAIRYPGPEIELLSEFALKHKVYLAGSTFEIDDALPGYVFNSAFILNDSGDLIHRYRKIQCADVWGSLPDTTPGSIYDRYLDTYGYDFLFPVADTPIGKLATIVCFDQAHPEIVRMLVKKGAEVIIHPSSEGHGSGRRGWDCARQTRAFENVAYLLSPLPGGEQFDPDSPYEHTNQMRGYTKMVNFDGSIQGELDTPGAAVLSGTVDLLALRRARANPHMNLPMWDDPNVYVDDYAADVGLENNLSVNPMENPYRGMKPLKKVLARYFKQGVFVPPTVPSSRSLSVPGKAQPDFDKPENEMKPKPKTLADEEKMDGEYIQV